MTNLQKKDQLKKKAINIRINSKLNISLDWYQKAYGDHAQKLLNVEEKKDDDEDDFESMFKAEETAANRQQGNQHDNQQLQDSKFPL